MNKYAIPILLTAAVISLVGCGSGTPRPAMIQPIGHAQDLDDAVSLLDQGQEKAARQKLEAMVMRDPSEARAQRLLDSLQANPVTVLGTRSFQYRVAPGDTMQSLARRYLGDRLKFYILARYNGIPVPAALKSGQAIRIPGQAPRAAAPVEPKPRPTVEAAKPSAPQAPVSPTNPRRAVQLRAAALAALNKGQVAQAVGSLQQALGLDPGNALILRDLARAQRIQQTIRARR